MIPPLIYKGRRRQRETDIVYQLGEALKRGVDVVALVPGRNQAIVKHYERQHRRRATDYLQTISTTHPGAGRFVLARQLRLALWQEHMELDEAEPLQEMGPTVTLFQEKAQRGDGRLRVYPHGRYRWEFPYRFFMNRLVDPYKGPER